MSGGGGGSDDDIDERLPLAPRSSSERIADWLRDPKGESFYFNQSQD